jgi:tRNA-Thr(GGU) m(6)t(6)A37 methyltransferase TsaA
MIVRARLRASQINGCRVCVDMHNRLMKKAGETDDRLFSVAVWRHTPYFTDAERAALSLTEAVTRLSDRTDPAPDEIWGEAARHYDEKGLAALILSIANINVWNRLTLPSGRWPASGRDEETNRMSFEVRAIGRVESSLTDIESAPRQVDESAPEAWLVFEPDMLDGLRSIGPGDEVILITWLDRARRDVLSVHPRGNSSREKEGVFGTRSPHRPNPIGLHRVEITAVDGRRMRSLEALDGTPIIDIKPILSGEMSQRREWRPG